MISSPSFRPSPKREFATPLTIGVVSDTHVFARGSRRLPDEVVDLFIRFRCGLVLHGGDVNTAAVLRTLEEIGPVLAVRGNNEDVLLMDVLPRTVEFKVGPHQFAMLHGHGGVSARSEARRYAGRVDCVVYGHSHIPLVEQDEGTILFNPGSATDRRWGPHFGVGLIHVTDEKINPELVLYTDVRHLRSIRPE